MQKGHRFDCHTLTTVKRQKCASASTRCGRVVVASGSGEEMIEPKEGASAQEK